MQGFSVIRSIEAPPDVVFSIFTDFRNAAKRVPSIHRVEMLTDGPIGAGTRFRETRVLWGSKSTGEMEITRFEPGDGYVVRCAAHDCVFTSAFLMRGEGTQTKVEVALTCEPATWLARVRLSLVLPIMRREFEKDFEALKRGAEAAARWAVK